MSEDKKLRKHILRFANGGEAVINGAIEVELGGKKPVEIEDVADLPDEDFKKLLTEPDAFTYDKVSKKVKKKK